MLRLSHMEESYKIKTSTIDKVKMRVQIKTALNILENPEFMSLFEQWDKDEQDKSRDSAIRHAKAALRELLRQLN